MSDCIEIVPCTPVSPGVSPKIPFHVSSWWQKLDVYQWWLIVFFARSHQKTMKKALVPRNVVLDYNKLVDEYIVSNMPQWETSSTDLITKIYENRFSSSKWLFN